MVDGPTPAETCFSAPLYTSQLINIVKVESILGFHTIPRETKGNEHKRPCWRPKQTK